MSKSKQFSGPQPTKQILPYEWYVQDTQLPSELCDTIHEQFMKQDPELGGIQKGNDQGQIRRVGVRWSLDGNWIGPFLWHYITYINDCNFQYDITGINGDLHHLEYRPGYHYKWHTDCGLANNLAWEPGRQNHFRPSAQEYSRKLSFILQLSEPEDYTGGEVQLFSEYNKDLFFVPRERGTLIIFDSRIRHRVRPLKSGKRFCLVGWAHGPRWR